MHFGQSEGEKNEFGVCKSNLENLNLKIFLCELTKLQIQFSQLLVGKITKFLCPSHRKFPEFFQHHLIFVFKPIPLKVMVIQTSEVFWGDHPEGRVFQI